MLWSASGKLVGIGSSFPSANALARIYIWIDVAPAASSALATTFQLRTSVDIWSWIKYAKILANLSGAWRKWNPPHSRTYKTKKTRSNCRAWKSFWQTCDQLSTPNWSVDLIRSVRTMDPTSGVSSLHLDGKKSLFSWHHTLDVPHQQKIYMSITLILR